MSKGLVLAGLLAIGVAACAAPEKVEQSSAPGAVVREPTAAPDESDHAGEFGTGGVTSDGRGFEGVGPTQSNADDQPQQ